MSERSKLVLFCGAGASASAGMPLMKFFDQAVRTCAALNAKARQQFDDIVRYCRPISSLAGCSARNFEDLASLLEVLSLSQPSLRIPLAGEDLSIPQVIKLLRDIVATVYYPESSAPFHAAFERNAWLANRYDLSVITTNYDLCIESSSALRCIEVISTESVSRGIAKLPQDVLGVAHVGGMVAYSLYDNCLVKSGRSVSQMHSRRSLRLYKLHGSVNWNVHANGALQVEHVWCWRDKSELAWDNVRVARSDGDPLILLPSPSKLVSNPIICEQWAGARSAIAQADELWFVGYSFPITDSFMRHFLADALSQNVRIKRIRVVDPLAHQIENRMKSFFQNPAWQDYVELCDTTWEQLGE